MERNSFKSTKHTNFCFEFPLDLLSQILGRLPAKTLLIFRCVSKQWKSLIDSSDFASLHFHLYNTTRQNVPLFLIEEHGYRRLRRCSIRCSDTFSLTNQFDLTNDFGRLYPVGYANGLVFCCKLDNGKVVSFVMWNPSTRKSTQIAYPPRSYFMRRIRVVLVHPLPGGANNDYKLVIIPCDYPSWKEWNRRVDPRRMNSTVLIEVYSFNTASWTSCSIPYKSLIWLSQSYNQTPTIVSLNGALHWVAKDPQDEPCIVVFDVRNNAIQYFGLPAERDIISGRLCVLHGWLVLVKDEYSGSQIWVMECYGRDESWVNRIKILTGYRNYDKSFLYVRRDGKFFFSAWQRLMVYDIHSRQLQNLAEKYKDEIILVDNFVETLALLPGGSKEPPKES